MVLAEGGVVERDTELQAAVELLGHARAAKRQSGAKRLRRLRRPAAGPALLAALQHEIAESGSWEAQYQMVMALAESGYTDALPYLESLCSRPFKATMVYTAIGDAIVRLGRSAPEDAGPVLRLMESGNERLIDGAFRAVAMLRLRLNPSAVDRIVTFAAGLPAADGLRFWVAAAAPGWAGPAVTAFLNECARGPREDVRTAAVAALKGEYRKWSPL